MSADEPDAPPALVVVEVPVADADEASGLLWSGGASAIEERPAGGDRVRLVAGSRDPDRLFRSIAGERPTAPEARAHPSWRVEIATVDDDRWADEWRAWARPVRAGSHLVVQPPWVDERIDGPGDVVVLIDPGRAFGSGSHPSTRQALALLEATVAEGDDVLDVGCGSGILAVTAARLGARRVVATDLDPGAGPATRANAKVNGVADRVVVDDRPVEELPGAHDVVLANIGALVLDRLAPALAARLAPGGTLVLAGLLTSNADGVVAAHARVGLVERQRMVDDDGWVAVRLTAG